jgi:hypothetical protein
MRIAVSGAHHTGKTTLISVLTGSLPTFSHIDEPYTLLEEEGHVFAAMPSVEDFELQLERSIEVIATSAGDYFLDRCPADLLAYLITHDESDGFDLDRWLVPVTDAMQQLDLIVFVAIEDPDRMPVSAGEHPHLRQRVDEELQALVLEDRWSFGVPTLEVSGSPAERARQVLAHLGDKVETQ